MRRTSLPPILLFLAAGCAQAASPDAWNGPVTDATNPDWPQCAASPDCKWGEKCAADPGECTRKVAGVDLARDWALKDENPASASFGDLIGPSLMAGNVVVVYFGLSTCPVCWQQAENLQATLTGLQQAGFANLAGVVVNAPGYGETVGQFSAWTALPVLQDRDDATADGSVWGIHAGLYGANKDFTMVLDANGFIRSKWAVLDFAGQRDVLEQAIWAARVD